MELLLEASLKRKAISKIVSNWLIY